MIAISADREEIVTDTGVFSLTIKECKSYVVVVVSYTNIAGAEMCMFSHEDDYKNMFDAGEVIAKYKCCMYDLYDSLCKERPIDFIKLFDV